MSDRFPALMLAICANPDGMHEAAMADLDNGDWLELADLAIAHRVAPLVWRAIGRAGTCQPPFGPGTARLKAAHDAGVRTVLLQRQALRMALAALAPKGITPIALKGVRLANRDYPHPALRPLRDFDLLVDRGEAEAAQNALEAAGFLAGNARYGLDYGHQLPELYHPPSRTYVEVHHRLNARGWDEEPRLLERMRAHAEMIEIEPGLVVGVPSATDNLLHLVEHATLHHVFDNGPLILADMHFAAHDEAIDWNRVLRDADDLGLGRAMNLVARLAASHGARWMPDGLRARSAARNHLVRAQAAMLRPPEAAKEAALLRRLYQRTGAKPGLRAGLRAIVRPDPESLAALAGVTADDPRRWFAWPKWVTNRMLRYARVLHQRSDAADASIADAALSRWLHDSDSAEG